jgi:organic hydroperoxide reductase OsmC/OhrA
MTGKTEKQFLFETQLNWIAGTRGILSARDADGVIDVATPPAFGGEGRPWTPEHLFLSSLSSCFMTTYLLFAKKMQFTVSHFDCNSIGQIKLVDGKYRFTQIDLYPKVYIENETLRQQANVALEKTHHYCLVANSIAAEIFYHSEVLTDPHPRKEAMADPLVKTYITIDEARETGDRLGIDFTRYSLAEFRKGLQTELEHGKRMGETNITNDNLFMTGKIAWAHLHEIPDYYTRLEKMEEEAEKEMGFVKSSAP